MRRDPPWPAARAVAGGSPAGAAVGANRRTRPRLRVTVPPACVQRVSAGGSVRASWSPGGHGCPVHALSRPVGGCLGARERACRRGPGAAVEGPLRGPAGRFIHTPVAAGRRRADGRAGRLAEGPLDARRASAADRHDAHGQRRDRSRGGGRPAPPLVAPHCRRPGRRSLSQPLLPQRRLVRVHVLDRPRLDTRRQGLASSGHRHAQCPPLHGPARRAHHRHGTGLQTARRPEDGRRTVEHPPPRPHRLAGRDRRRRRQRR